jgi:photosystem II stability/assembly factor-like uncharacterized protein
MSTRALACVALVVVITLTAGTGRAQNGETGLFKEFVWRSIGPVNMSGRIDDIEAVESDPHVIYVGAATGGVWKTANNGTTWAPIFDDQPNLSIGDIAIAPSNPNIVWVGTGEPNNRQSSSYGAGVFKSTDAGATWSFMGLGDSGAIGRIVVDPKNPNVVYVAAVGDLFKAHPERGLFKTSDGGRTWTKSKAIDDDTGFSELVMHPQDNRVLFAASYQRRRTAFGFNGGGPGSGLWKTADAGQTWTKIDGGLPPTGQWGRTGLAIHRANPRVMYALIQPGPPPAGQPDPSAPPDPRRDGMWKSEDGGATWKIVNNFNGRPSYFSQVRVDAKNAQLVYVLGRQAYKSVDGGKTFEPMGDEPLFGRDYSPDAKGRRGPAHVDHHALWLDPNDSDHLILGHDGGVDFSYDGGRSWEFQDKMPLGQFYEVAVDMRRPYYVYGGAQDRGMWGGPSRVTNIGGITKADWFMLQDGDGFHVRVDPDDWATVYARVAPGGGGTVWRFDLRTGVQKYIRPRSEPLQIGTERHEVNVLPKPEAGEVYRFNWNTPIALSPHNSRVVYYGGHRLFKSYDRGDTWTFTKDLTKALDRGAMTIMGVPNAAPITSKNDGVAQYGTIVAIAESPLVPGLLWVGTDDGNLQVSRDGGATWTNVADRIARFEQNYYVETIEPSHVDPGTAYVGLDGHYWGDFKPHLFKTSDYGETWTRISANLPERGHVNAIREDLKNPRLLYVATEAGVFVSLDGGQAWTKFMNNLPAVPADDLVIHPREQDLVLATHGRSFYILDDTSPLQQLTPEVLAQDAHLFTVRPAVLWNRDVPHHRGGGTAIFRAQNPPDGAIVSYYLKTGASELRIQVLDALGSVVREMTGPREPGIHRVQWDLRRATPAGARPVNNPLTGTTLAPAGPLVAPGDYAVRLTTGGRTVTTSLRVERDPNE